MRYLDRAARELNQPDLFDLRNLTLPCRVEHFEDFLPLFWSSPLNRGVLRQDFDEAAALFSLVRGMYQPTGVEIGRLYGGSTILLAAAVGEAGRLISIDIAPRDDDALRSTLTRTGLMDRVQLVVADANEVSVEEPVDFVFVDGDHRYEGTKRDHNRWTPQVHPGGFVIYHDMANARVWSTQREGLSRLRSEILAQLPAQLTLLREVGSLAIWQRTGARWTPLC